MFGIGLIWSLDDTTGCSMEGKEVGTENHMQNRCLHMRMVLIRKLAALNGGSQDAVG